MSDGAGLLDALMDSGDGGASGRRRGGRRVDSMIAGRRKPSADGNAEADEKSSSRSSRAPAQSSTQRASSRRRTTKAAAEKKPAAKRTSAKAKKDTAAAEPKKPARRRRAPRAKVAEKPVEETPEAVTDEAMTDETVTDEAVTEEAVTDETVTEEAEPVVETPVEEEEAAEVTARPTPPARVAELNGDLPAGVQRELADLRGLVEEQRSLLTELRAGLTAVAAATDRAGYRPRLGIFVDVPNVMYGVDASAKPVHMGKLLDFLSDGRELVRATAYSPVSDDPREPMEQQKFVAPFVPYNYRITTKPLKRFADGSIKGNFDVEMALDMLQMADRLDVLSIVSGDADFSRAVEAVQTRGVRVEVVAFAGSASIEMRALADRYIQLDSVVDQIT